MNKIYLGAIFAAFILVSCGGSDFKKAPVDVMIRDMDSLQNYTIILYDMDVESGFPDKYKHRYKIIKEKPDGTPYDELTNWYDVDESTFAYYENDMGMEVASKLDGKVTKETSPPGYSKYVGNQKYGNWRTDNSGRSFWEFYGQYAFMSNMIGLFRTPIYRTGYYDYYNNYRGRRPYYGPVSNGSYKYGTLSSLSRKQNPNFFKRATTNNALKSRVNNSISRSSSSSRTTRSSSRYSTSSSSSARSRSSSSGGK
ncbi:hypothetical protein [Chondrinema litorale]|uniref:hypothetical protein n=1 Tax=Chondrinema litorale TaxID=2994555 RepID=UPI0025427B86|nr:hypothetical protein [Chondrinema litorale]UZR94633.1 hypothetical protein OQ292_02220 [Chondrinema litorale]